LLAVENAFPHPGSAHTNGFSPVCVRKWVIRADGVGNTLPHRGSVQACFFARFVIFVFFAALTTFMSTFFSSLMSPSLSSLPRLRFFAAVFFAPDFSFFTAFSLSRLRFFGSAVVVTSTFSFFTALATLLLSPFPASQSSS
jgi:hypothetical protein